MPLPKFDAKIQLLRHICKFKPHFLRFIFYFKPHLAVLCSYYAVATDTTSLPLRTSLYNLMSVLKTNVNGGLYKSPFTFISNASRSYYVRQ